MKMFMSYRRQDSEWVSLSLFNSLKQQFPKDAIFKDFNVIRAGEDFTKAIENNLKSCDVLLVVIGPEWLNCKDGVGRQRLFDPDDYVSLEIASAFKYEKKVIPVLINSTLMPVASALPDRIKELHKLQAVTINSSNFEMDVFSLANAIHETTGKRNQYADIVKDIATGKVSQQELMKPETNAAYAIICICLGLLILFLNSDSTPFVLICAIMAGVGVYAYFLSQTVKSLWLNKDFEKARQNAKSTKLISLIAPISGLVLLVIVMLLQGLQFLADGGMNQVNDLVKKVQSPSLPHTQTKIERQTAVPVQEQSTTDVQGKVMDVSNQTTYVVARNTYIFNNPNLESATTNFLYAGSQVHLLSTELDFAQVEFTNVDGKKYTCWVASADLNSTE